MEFRQIRLFLEIVRAGGFHRAAASLRVAQPAISVAIRNLEEELGVTLFDRERKKVQLTAEGRAFLRRATALEELLRETELEMGELRGVERGELRLGLPSMLASHVFPEVITGFRQRYPGLHIFVYGGGGVRIVEMIEKDEIELGIVAGSHVPENLDYMPLLREEMVACVAKNHPLAHSSSITLKEFASEDLFLFEKGFFQRELVENLFRGEELRPKVVFETNHVPLLITMAASGGGATTLLRLAAEAAPSLVPLSFKPPLFVDAGVAWKRRSYVSSAARAFLQYLQSSFEGKNAQGDEKPLQSAFSCSGGNWSRRSHRIRRS